MDDGSQLAALADRVVFVLVQPQHPGNVGAAARGMANMGLRRLIVVDPSPAFDAENVRWMASSANEVLEDMRIVPDLDAAFEGVHRAVATTARHRRHQQPVHRPEVVAQQILDADADVVTAILFGREDMGLSRSDSVRCESLLRIPTAEHASLNLGAAVLLTAHHIFEAAQRRGLDAPGRSISGRRIVRTTRDHEPGEPALAKADLRTLEPVIGELYETLDRVGYTKRLSPERVAVTLREALQRANLTRRQVTALRGMNKRFGYALDHPDQDWRASKREKTSDANEHD